MGVGEHVMRQVIEQVRFRGASLITLEVRPSNTAALALYRKLGFKLMGIRKGYYTIPSEDALVLGLRLGDAP
jgi:ribosomal-protein-alanine N-acetyltransferase